MKLWLIGTVAAAALLTGCGKKDDTAAAGASADAIEVAGAELPAVQLRAGNADQAEAALGALSLTESGSGRISFGDRSVTGADASFSNVEIIMADDGNDSDAGLLVAQTLTLKGLDMTDGQASFSQMRLDGVTIRSDGDADEGLLNIADMQISNPSPALAAWVGSLLGQGEPADFPELSELSFDAASFSNLTAVPSEGEDELEEFKIDSVNFRNMSPEGLGAMVLEGLNFRAVDASTGQVSHASLGSLSLMGVGEVVTKALGAELDSDQVPAELLQLLAANPADPGYDVMRLADLDIDVAGLAIALPSYNQQVTRDDQGRAVRTVLEPIEATIGADPNGEFGSELAGPLGLMGYETLVVRAASDTRVDHDNDMITTDPKSNYLEVADGFRLSGGGEIEGLSSFYTKMAEQDLGRSNSDPDAVLSSLSAMQLHGLEISFEDNSFVDRAFSAAAAMNGGTPDELKDQLKLSLGLAPLMSQSIGIDPDIVTELTTALGSFISKPGTLTLSLDPQTPIGVDMLENPEALTKDVLGFSATSK